MTVHRHHSPLRSIHIYMHMTYTHMTDIYKYTLFFIGTYTASFFKAFRNLGQNYDPFIFNRLTGCRIFYVKEYILMSIHFSII